MPILKLLFFKDNKSDTSVIDYFCLSSAQLSVLGQVTFGLGNSAFFLAFFIGNLSLSDNTENISNSVHVRQFDSACQAVAWAPMVYCAANFVINQREHALRAHRGDDNVVI